MSVNHEINPAIKQTVKDIEDITDPSKKQTEKIKLLKQIGFIDPYRIAKLKQAGILGGAALGAVAGGAGVIVGGIGAALAGGSAAIGTSAVVGTAAAGTAVGAVVVGNEIGAKDQKDDQKDIKTGREMAKQRQDKPLEDRKTTTSRVGDVGFDSFSFSHDDIKKLWALLSRNPMSSQEVHVRVTSGNSRQVFRFNGNEFDVLSADIEIGQDPDV